MKNTNTVKKNKKTGNTTPAKTIQTSFAFANHADTGTNKKDFADILIDMIKTLSNRSNKQAKDFAKFRADTNARLSALEAVA